MTTSPEQIVAGFLESIACRTAVILDRLRPHLPPGVRVVAGGGALCGSPAWQQIVADALGAPLELTKIPQASARGSALMALKALGRLADYKQALSDPGRVIEPIGEHHQKYLRMIERQDRLSRTLSTFSVDEGAGD